MYPVGSYSQADRVLLYSVWLSVIFLKKYIYKCPTATLCLQLLSVVRCEKVQGLIWSAVQRRDSKYQLTFILMYLSLFKCEI